MLLPLGVGEEGLDADLPLPVLSCSLTAGHHLGNEV